jgi:MarR family 2-MHQ and catechol resistance regulon transcriptional repressor
MKRAAALKSGEKQASKKQTGARQALETYTVLVRATESTTARIHKHLEASGLTISQFGVLEALYHIGPLCQKDLAVKILKTSGNLTMVIDNLEKSVLVRRERDTHDRRLLVISLTDTGRKLISRLFPKHAAIVAREMAVLSQAEQKALAKLCKKLGLAEST